MTPGPLTLPRHAVLADELEHPIVQAPMGGGASTPALAAAVSEAGGLGFLAAGYLAPGAVRADIEAVRELTRRPFGINLFAPPRPVPDPGAVERYARALAQRHGAEVGEPRHDDDGWEEKLALVAELRVPVVSITFGCPEPAVVARLHEAGAAVWVTVTTRGRGAPRRARRRRRAGRAGRRGRRSPGDLRRHGAERPRAARGAPAGRGRERAAARRDGRARDRPRRSPRCSPPARPRHSSAPRSCSPPRRPPRRPTGERAGRRRRDRAHARIHRPHRARDRQPLPARAHRRRSARLSGRPSRHGAAAQGRARARGRRRLPPLGGPGARARRAGAGGRAGAPSRGRGADGAARRGA